MVSRNTLKRELGIPGATLMGMGAMVGTGVFVSIGIAAGVAGPAVVAAIALAALVATCNALSSAQLAASMPVSGGTYEYGYRYLKPWLGFTAGWMFLCAKTASAATAALGFAGYLLQALGIPHLVVPVAVAAVAVFTIIVAAGISQSNRVNVAIVAVTLLALTGFVLVGIMTVASSGGQPWAPFIQPQDDSSALAALLQATALMFVAFTGYARIATLGEEVVDPRRTIPRAIVATLVFTAVLYMAVGAVGISTVGSKILADAAQSEVAPLVIASRAFIFPDVHWLVTLGALTAMLGVLLNLLLGLSRVILAMGRRSDLPKTLSQVNDAGSPVPAVILAGAAVAGIVLVGDVKTTWSFSAFTVLIYYGITNLAALRLPKSERLYPAFIAWTGLVACLFLAFWVEQRIWLAGLALIAGGLLWHAIAQRGRQKS
jgi:APA family basic amino acid/polyamine antiporter